MLPGFEKEEWNGVKEHVQENGGLECIQSPPLVLFYSILLFFSNPGPRRRRRRWAGKWNQVPVTTTSLQPEAPSSVSLIDGPGLSSFSKTELGGP